MILFKKIVLLVFGVFFLASCQEKKSTPKPDNLIPEDKMVNILVDLAKINGANNISSKSFKERDIEPKDLIFKKYNIDSLQLVENSNYYADNFKKNKNIYTKVEAILQRETDSLNAIAEEKKKEEKKDKK